MTQRLPTMKVGNKLPIFQSDAERERIRKLRWEFKRMDTPARRRRHRPKKLNWPTSDLK
jgi:hypothetical protein